MSTPDAHSAPSGFAQITALKAPFAPSKIKFRDETPYVDPAEIQDRLDDVFGAGWKVDYAELNGAVQCRIEVMADGQWIGRAAVGGTPDEAFELAALAWGLGRYLKTNTLAIVKPIERKPEAIQVDEPIRVIRDEAPTVETPIIDELPWADEPNTASGSEVMRMQICASIARAPNAHTTPADQRIHVAEIEMFWDRLSEADQTKVGSTLCDHLIGIAGFLSPTNTPVMRQFAAYRDEMVEYMDGSDRKRLETVLNGIRERLRKDRYPNISKAQAEARAA